MAAPPESERRGRELAVVLIVAGVCMVAIGTGIYAYRHLAIDDAYITYRYAKNLADGHGLAWNPGSPPTEGLTNLLLAFLLAPAIKVGLDPLGMTRVLSLAALGALIALLYWIPRKEYSQPRLTAACTAALLALAPATVGLVMIGLETVVYAFLVFGAFLLGRHFLGEPTTRSAVGFGLASFVVVLMRPDGGLLFVAVFAAALFVYRDRLRIHGRPLAAALAAFGLPLVLFGIWKISYFGNLLPNSFYVKSSGVVFLSEVGVDSVVGFVLGNGVIVLVAIASFLPAVWTRWQKLVGDVVARDPGRMAGLLFVCSTSLFYVRTETLQDDFHRFMYPVLPILIFLAIPTIAIIVDAVAVRFDRVVVLAALIVFGLLVAVGVTHDDLDRMTDVSAAREPIHLSNDLLSPEVDSPYFEMGRQLGTLDGIQDRTIAYYDSGLIPYFSGAKWLDMVGLNDGFIARHRDSRALKDYFFDAKADIVMLPSYIGSPSELIAGAHGPLGDIPSWSDDPRWDDYEYVGTVNVPSTYDVNMLVRSDARGSAALREWLREHVVDGWYDSAPFPLGTRPANPSAEWNLRR